MATLAVSKTLNAKRSGLAVGHGWGFILGLVGVDMTLPSARKFPDGHLTDVHLQNACPFVKIHKLPFAAGKRLYADVPACASPDGTSSSSVE